MRERLVELNYKRSKHKLGLFYKTTWITKKNFNNIYFIDLRSTTQSGNIGFWMKKHNLKLIEGELNKFKRKGINPVKKGRNFYYLYPIYNNESDKIYPLRKIKPVWEELLEYSEDSKYSDNNIARECAICGKRYSPFSSSIVKHHLLYPDKNWKGLEVTVTVCRSCHGKIHMTDEHPRLKPSYWKISNKRKYTKTRKEHKLYNLTKKQKRIHKEGKYRWNLT